MKKVLVLFFVVLSVLSFATPAKQADAISGCPAGYKMASYDKTFYLDDGYGNPAGAVVYNADYCYNGTDLIADVHVYAYAIHRFWTLASLTGGGYSCGDNPDCMSYAYSVQFNRVDSYGYPRRPVCAMFTLELEGNSDATPYVISPKHQC
jgi:hypothetical protein